MSIEFQPITKENISNALEIYNWYVINSTATFHLEAVPEKELERMVSMGHTKYQSFVIIYNNQICGFCYLSQFRYKEAYDKSAEITLYLKQGFLGKGIGKTTLTYLEKIAKENEINNLVAVITEGNDASIILFEKDGYFKIGHLKNIGEKFGKTLDVVSYQKEI
jgi:L-amino acid N-acyltransferase YncA